MCSLIAKLYNELDESQLQTESDCIDEEIMSKEPPEQTYMIAKRLQMEMKTKTKEQRSKCFDTPGESIQVSYKYEENFIPNVLYNFIAWMVTKTEFISSVGIERVSLRLDHEKVLNISQDLIFFASRVAMPKQIGLALHILRQTRSKALVRTLNRFGYSISDDGAQQYITSMANLVNNKIENDKVFIPANLNQGNFLQCGFDNLDFFRGHTQLKNTSCHDTYIVPISRQK